MVYTSDIERRVKHIMLVDFWHYQMSLPPPLYEDIVTHSEDKMQRFINRFAHACKVFALEINLKKTVVMHDPLPGLPFIEPAIYLEHAC